MIKKKLTLLFTLLILVTAIKAQLTENMALRLAELPLKSIHKEFPNKPGHVYNNADEVVLTPRDLHPAFYGSFDWHSSVHGHWMLVRVLKNYPRIPDYQSVIKAIDKNLTAENLQTEAEYFSKYENAKLFERTYGWAWLLKLDSELMNWDNEVGKKWYTALQPLTEVIVDLWREYLPKQTYPNRTGVHPNSAFGLSFAIDWTREKGDSEFEAALVAKAIEFYGNEKNTPAWLEPDGSDFFSPSLQIASLMSRIYSKNDFAKWYRSFLSKRSFENLTTLPKVSNLNDYQIVHLVGLSFSRAWCMKDIARQLPAKNKNRAVLLDTADKLIEHALPQLFSSNYGGDHWLASFALMAIDDKIE